MHILTYIKMGQLNLDKSIKRVLASVHPDLNMSTDAKIIMNNGQKEYLKAEDMVNLL